MLSYLFAVENRESDSLNGSKSKVRVANEDLYAVPGEAFVAGLYREIK